MTETYYINDFGCNFAGSRYSDEKLDQIMKRAWDSGIDKIVCISNDINEAKRCVKLAEKYENLYFTVGTHPHSSNHFCKKDLTIYGEQLKNPKAFGVGEIGLDFNRNFSSKTAQIDAFEAQILLAKKTNSKMYLHCRDAFDEFIQILDKHAYYNGIVHCFTGNIHQALEFTKHGLKLGITGWILDKRRNKDLIECVKDERITLDMLIVETDAPHMPLYFLNKNKKESTPEDLYYVVEEIARLKNIDQKLCGDVLYDNSLNFLKKS